MSRQIHQELLLFGRSLLAGLLLAVLYSLIKTVRLLLPEKKAAFRGDFLFGIGSCLFLFHCFYRNNDGILRLYLFLSVFAGTVLWKITLEIHFITILLRILKFPVKWARILRKRLLFLSERCKILVLKSCFLRKSRKLSGNHLVKRSEKGGKKEKKEKAES